MPSPCKAKRGTAKQRARYSNHYDRAPLKPFPSFSISNFGPGQGDRVREASAMTMGGMVQGGSSSPPQSPGGTARPPGGAARRARPPRSTRGWPVSWRLRGLSIT